MADPVVGAVERVAKSWREEAAERRRISTSDPVADTLVYCAGELAARLKALAADLEEETVDQVATREHVTPQTVREWCRSGQIPARRGPKGYLIAKGAERTRRAG